MPVNGLATLSLAKPIFNRNLARPVVKNSTWLLQQNWLGKNSKKESQPTSAVSKSKKNRIYVGALDLNLKSEYVKAVFEAFSKIENCQLIPNSDGSGHKGYCFIEYEKVTSAAEAVKSMNEFELCGRNIRINFSFATGTHSNTIQIQLHMELTPKLQIVPL